MAEALKTLFSREVQSEIFPKWEFYKNSKMDGSPNADQASVDIGQSGSVTVERNRDTSSEATSAKRTDTTLSYSLVHLSTDPIHVPDADEIVLAYSKRQDIVQAFAGALNSAAAKELLYAWAPAVANKIQYVRTTGADSADNLPHATATGTRKSVTKADLVKAFTLMNNQDIPEKGRYLVIPATMYGNIVNIDDFVSAEKIGRANLVDGAIGRILGFDVFMRSEGVLYTNVTDPVKKAVDATLAVSDNNSAICYQRDFVRRSEGRTRIFYNPGMAKVYGDQMSADLRVGGSHARTDAKGVVAIIQAA